MRHRKKGRKLNRTASHRKALMRNLANDLFEHKEITTTTAKAKEARSAIERLISHAKKGDLHHRRLVFGYLRRKKSVDILFDEIAPAYSDRQGGYTRVLKLGRRAGDGAPLSLLQLVGFEKLGDFDKEEKKKKSKKKARPEPAAAETQQAKETEKEVRTGEPETDVADQQTETPEEKDQPEKNTEGSPDEPDKKS